MSEVSLSIVVPAYNEARRLAAGFERLRDTLDELGVDRTEVVVVDDGSSDDTLGVAREVYGHLPHARVVQQPVNRGKGAAVRLGISVAVGDYVIATDADMSIRPRHLPDYVAALASTDLAPGSRVADPGVGYDSVVRTAAGRAFNLMVRHYTHTTLRDTQCGCKGFRLGPARVLGLLGFYDRFVYDAEMLFLADQLGLRVRPVDVTWDDIAGSSVHVLRDSLQMVRDLRSFRRTRYENPVVECGPDVDVGDVASLARAARLVGLALARGDADTLVVLPRDGAAGGVGLAQGLGGSLRTTGISELRGRTFEGV
ncbi:MAG: glycosyltransferase [Acidimicrobiales bacterium]